MDLRIFTEPQQGATYSQLLAVARATEDLGFDAFFRSDHYLKMGGVSGLPGPTDAWLTLAALARDTERVRLGTLVTAMTFRLPGPLAISVAQVDEMSGGRVELGLGTGWYEDEHRAYGIPFPPLGERFDRFEEQLAAITGLWDTPEGGTFSMDGRFYAFTDSPALPKPVQSPHPPIIIGGGGPRRTPALAARYADEFNLPFAPLDGFVQQKGRVEEACRSIDRDPASMRFSAALVVCCGADEREVSHRAGRIGREPDELRANGAAGTPDEVLATLRRWADAGASRIYLQVLDLDDLDHLSLLAERVLPEVADL
ncbi:LLM class F420-dependent oxidoreductase [Actinomarinicola tropica]|uniref:TIGR03560 family F420-dependent LLM class oxidoreductase n=1 Tax=Actinomarinicola tropica TaxID=2789776 RepID=A0A5Q2RA10_9ACTN|nr:LLM class F420-dependent oxidoreductase [Actinomarinicola tropica]QGG93719.1 TIGR03560 family F420-dependent LLM class oxidoreductase [Actinomarinicola tropica]